MREMTAAYAAARELNGVVYKCEPVVDLGAVVAVRGGSKASFPLPSARPIGESGESRGLGLRSNITSPACRSIQYDSELKGYWLEITAKYKDEQVISSFVLLSESKDGAEAIILTLSPSQRAMLDVYRTALKQPNQVVQLESSVALNDQIQPNGTTQNGFAIPGGRSLGQEGTARGLGLGKDITSPACRSIQYDSELKGYWLKLTAKDINEQVVSSFVLVSEDKDGAEAIVLTLSPSQRAMLDVYRTALKQPNQVVQLESSVALDDQISLNGVTQRAFALPGGRSLGREGAGRGLGLVEDITSPACCSIQYDSELKGYWLELTAKDKSQQVVSSFVLVSVDKNGAEAIVLTLSSSQRAMLDAYRIALKQPNQVVQLESAVALDDQIRARGVTQNCFALPGGRSLRQEGLHRGLGLGRNITSPSCRSIQYAPSLKGYWLGLQAIDQNGRRVESYVLLDEKAGGAEAIQLTLTPDQKAIFDAYQFARASDSATTLNIELRSSIGAVNLAKASWLKPSCETIGQGKSISLSKTRPLTSFTATQIHHLGNDRFVIWTTAKYADGGIQHVRLLSSNDGLTVIGQSENDSAQICKGFALDRYAAHLAAVAKLPSAVANPSFKGSALTGENYVPNMKALETVIHAKWGKQPREVLDFILSYGRMMRWHGLPVGCMLLADDTHHEALLAATTAAAEELKFNLGISTVAQWAGAVMKEMPNIKGELDKLQVMADLGMEVELKSQSYSPTLQNMATGPTTPGVDWQTRVETLTTQDGYDVLTETLDKHLTVHSPSWEEPYHMQLAKCCSYLLENKGDLTLAQHDAVKSKVLSLYPELADYPDAWRTLDSEAARNMPRNQDLTLTKFDLVATLEALKAPRISTPPQSDDTPERGTGHVIEIPALRDFIHRSNSVTETTLSAFLSEAAELKVSHPENTTIIANAALYAACKVLANEEKYWRASPKLAEFKNGAGLARKDIPMLQNDLAKFRSMSHLLNRIDDLFA